MDGYTLFQKYPLRLRSELALTHKEAEANFTPDELKTFTETFILYDANRSGDLDVFELNKMYESRGETKTHVELRKLIDEANQTEKVKREGITYQAYLSILLKDKKGLLKDNWGSFAVIAKKHDDAKKTGKLANVFEQKAAEGKSEEARMKADMELRKADREAKQKEKERKAKVQAGLAALQAGIKK